MLHDAVQRPQRIYPSSETYHRKTPPMRERERHPPCASMTKKQFFTAEPHEMLSSRCFYRVISNSDSNICIMRIPLEQLHALEPFCPEFDPASWSKPFLSKVSRAERAGNVPKCHGDYSDCSTVHWHIRKSRVPYTLEHLKVPLGHTLIVDTASAYFTCPSGSPQQLAFGPPR